MPRVIAYYPDHRGRNPPRSTSLDAALSGRLVRFEAPEELDGKWLGPVYARLGPGHKHLQPGDDSPFSRDDDGQRAPAWQARLLTTFADQDTMTLSPDQRAVLDEVYWVPYWRLTQPGVGLLVEERERPLLSVFRFVRVAHYYTVSATVPNKLVRRTSDVLLCGQVLTYHRSAASTLVDDIDVVIEPGSDYICTIAIRSHTNEPRQVVAITLPEFRQSTISRAEFILGFLHGYPVGTAHPDFNLAWSIFKNRGPYADRAVARARLAESFAFQGSPISVIDVGAEPISMVLPNGRVSTINPTAFAQQACALPTVQDGDDEHVPAPLDEQLLSRAETEWTVLPPAPAAPRGRAPPTPAPSTAPGASSRATPVPALAGQTNTERVILAMLQEHHLALQEQRAAQQALAAQIAQLTATVAAAQAQRPLSEPPAVPRLPDQPRDPPRTPAIYDVDFVDDDLDRPRSTLTYLAAHGRVDPRSEHHRASARERRAPPPLVNTALGRARGLGAHVPVHRQHGQLMAPGALGRLRDFHVPARATGHDAHALATDHRAVLAPPVTTGSVRRIMRCLSTPMPVWALVR